VSAYLLQLLQDPSSNCWKLAADAPEALRTIPAAAPEIVCSAPKARLVAREK
jgi:hypothetical protein